MFSRFSIIPKYNLYSRQISKSAVLSNKFLIKDEKKVDLNQELSTDLNKNVPKLDENNVSKDTNKPKDFLNKRLQNNLNDLKYTKKNDFKKPEFDFKKPFLASQLASSKNSLLDSIKKKINENFVSNKSFKPILQELNNLYDKENFFENFSKDMIKSKLTEKLLLKVNSLTDKIEKDDLLSTAIYLIRYDPTKLSYLNTSLGSIIQSLSPDQLVDLVYILRKSPKVLATQKITLINSTNQLQNRLNDLESFKSTILAMKLFAADELAIKKLDHKIMQSKEKLTGQDWIDLLNTKSILRQRNLTLIETCAFSLINNNVSLELDSIQKVLLSCGILNYNDEQFYLYLVKNLANVLDKSKSDRDWLVKNEANMLSIINSIGMLQIREKSILDNIGVLLQNSTSSKLITSYIITCGFVCLEPTDKKAFESLIAKVNLDSFSLTSLKGKLLLLNFVSSLCILDRSTDAFLASVLNENFWNEFLDESNKMFKPMLLKIMQINFYSQLFHDTYNGPFLPPEINAANYANKLKPDHDPLADQLVSTLTSFRPIEKYFKANLLTPFGIHVDALMVIDGKGNICLLNEYLDENSQLETKKPEEKKIAIKIVHFKDRTKINHKINGNMLLQLVMLKELGYTTVLISQSELSEQSVIKRIDLIKKKLVKASQKTDEIFIE